MLYLKLFLEFLKVSSFTFGGGIAGLPYIYELSERTGWFDYGEVSNMVTISQITPGPLLCNMATYVGYKMSGILGAVISTIAIVIPTLIAMYLIYRLYEKFKENKRVANSLNYIRAATLAGITTSIIPLFKETFANSGSIVNYKAIIYAIILAIIMKYKKGSTLFYICASGVIGIIFKFYY